LATLKWRQSISLSFTIRNQRFCMKTVWKICFVMLKLIYDLLHQLTIDKYQKISISVIFYNNALIISAGGVSSILKSHTFLWRMKKVIWFELWLLSEKKWEKGLKLSKLKKVESIGKSKMKYQLNWSEPVRPMWTLLTLLSV